jgi:dihydrofolate reductase
MISMKCFIIAAQSADGFIAKDSSHAAFWTSKEDKHRFIELTKQAGVVVMGSTTYKTLPRALKERRNIIYTRSNEVFEGAETTQESPLELLTRLHAEGHHQVAICGGSQIYTMFAKAGLVEKIYLTIEPIIFGKGISLFSEDLLLQLKLESHVKTEGGTLLLEYLVKNHNI